jgi:hypothetical protein
LLRLANASAFVGVLVLNGLAGSGALSGQSIGVIANQYPSYFLPANYVFGIWSLIYLGLGAFVIYQLAPVWQAGDAARRLGLGWIGNAFLNTAWLTAFSFGRFVTAWLLMVLLLLNLVMIHEKLGLGRRELTWPDRAFVGAPFAIYLAWISVALIANTFQLVTFLGWGGFGVPGPVWSAGMLIVAGVLSAAMAVRRSSWAFPLVFAWAFVGIAARYSEIGLIAFTALAVGILGVGLRVWLQLSRPAP